MTAALASLKLSGRRHGAMIVITRFREILLPLLVVAIIASLWIVGRAQEMEDDVRTGVGASPRWTALVDYSARTSAD
jgi:hypothetical protein